MRRTGPLEGYLSEAFVTFDGRVFESFGPTKNQNGRVHAATLAGAWLEDSGGRTWLRFQTIWRTSPLLIEVAAERRQFAEHLVQVMARVTQRYRGA